MFSTKKCSLPIGYYMKCILFIFLFVWAFSGQNATIRLLEIPKTFRYSYCISNFVEQQVQIFILISIQCKYSIKYVKSCENTIGIVFKHYCQVVRDSVGTCSSIEHVFLTYFFPSDLKSVKKTWFSSFF